MGSSVELGDGDVMGLAVVSSVRMRIDRKTMIGVIEMIILISVAELMRIRSLGGSR